MASLTQCQSTKPPAATAPSSGITTMNRHVIQPDNTQIHQHNEAALGLMCGHNVACGPLQQHHHHRARALVARSWPLVLCIARTTYIYIVKEINLE